MENHERHEKIRKKALSTEDTENTEIKFDGLLGLFEQTQATMQRQAARSVDIALVVRNWLFGWYLVVFENGGAERAEMYGKELIKQLSCKLTETLGKEFSKRSLEQYRKFYLAYSEIAQALPAQSPGGNTIQQALSVTSPETLQSAASKLTERFILGWTHYVAILTVKNPGERRFYELEAAKNDWGYRELERQINSALYERLALSRDKDEVKRLNAEGQIVENASDIIKSPYILEFTGLETRKSYSEYDLETALINKIEHFLLELGKGFLFESRQKRFSFSALKEGWDNPNVFQICTPLGTYNPDWAVLIEVDGKEKLYFVVETKSTLFTDALRPTEKAEIACGKEHFKALGKDVEFAVTNAFEDFSGKYV